MYKAVPLVGPMNMRLRVPRVDVFFLNARIGLVVSGIACCGLIDVLQGGVRGAFRWFV